MELHIIYKKAGQKGQTETVTKVPVTLSSTLDYEEFLGAISQVAGVHRL